MLRYLHWAVAIVGFCAMVVYSLNHDATSNKGFAAAYGAAMLVMHIARMIEMWISYRRTMRREG